MEATRDNTIVIIPAYNEARAIGGVVRGVAAAGFRALVIDDGSSDDTQKEALDNGAMVVRNKKNSGKGLSVREGAGYVLDKTNYEWMIFMDGDGQHHPEDIPNLISATAGNDADIVIGNRMAETKTMPSVRYWTNRFMSWVLSRMCGQCIPDSQCGFRLIGVAAFKKMELMTDKYDIESEVLIEAAKNHLKIVSVPVRTIYGNEVSAINPVRDTIKFLRLIHKHYSVRKGSLRTK